jgi:hypothetical protein
VGVVLVLVPAATGEGGLSLHRLGERARWCAVNDGGWLPGGVVQALNHIPMTESPDVSKERGSSSIIYTNRRIATAAISQPTIQALHRQPLRAAWPPGPRLNPARSHAARRPPAAKAIHGSSAPCA